MTFRIQTKALAQLALVLLSSLWGSACASSPGPEPVEEAAEALFAAPLDAHSYVVTVDVPDDVLADDIALEAKGSLIVGLNTQVTGGMVANIGATLTAIGPVARVGPTTSVAPVTLLSHTVVDGDLRTSGALVRLPRVTVTGNISSKTSLPSKNDVLMRIDVPGAGQGTVFVRPFDTVTLAPNSYGRVTVAPLGKVRLTAGKYYFGTLDVQLGSTLEVDTTAGLVTATVLDKLFPLGTMKHVRTGTATISDFAVLYLGSWNVDTATPFLGTLVAPNAKISLAPTLTIQHQGAFFARDIELKPGAKVTHRPFHWDTFRGQRKAPVVIHAVDAPVPLLARIFSSGETDPATFDAPSAVSVVIQNRLEVEAGNAGNGRAVLRLGSTTCQYRGGAASMPPSAGLDEAKGKFFNLESCSDGHHAGDTITATHFGLDLLDPNPQGRVAVHLALGDGCTPSIGYPMDPEESIRTSDAFDWTQTTPLPELDSRGRPNLYYFNVYIENMAQLHLLEDMKVPFEYMPLLAPERAKFAGRCGPVNLGGDGRGIFVYAMIPANLYNLIRTAAIDPSVQPNDPTRWRAMPRRAIPAEVSTANGAFSYEVLARAGFKYEPRSEKHPRRQRGVTQPLFGGIAEFFVDTANELRDVVGEGFAAVDKLVSGTVDLDVDFTVLDRSGAFPAGAALRRGWGNRTGSKLVPDGIDLEINYGVLGIPQIEATLGEDGTARFIVPDGADLEDICLVLENDAARIKGLVDVYSVCNFRIAQEMEHSDSFSYETNDWMVHLHAQLTDGYHYMRDVVGHHPEEANVTVGAWANQISVEGKDNQERIYTPCLDFPNVTTAAFDLLTNTIFGPLSIASDILTDTDIVFPSDNAASMNSRVATHEYGHFALCSLVYNTNPETGIASLIVEGVGDGNDLDPDNDNTRILNEAFADFFTMQVAGGTNYFKPGIHGEDLAFESGGAVTYCVRPAPEEKNPPEELDARHYCIEDNLSRAEVNVAPTGNPPTPSPGKQEIGRLVGLFQDAFDGHTDANIENVPTNATMYRKHFGQVEVEPWFYRYDDDPVQLSGSAIIDWFDKWDADVRDDALEKPTFLKALADTAYANGATWCDACILFSQHSDQVARSVRDGTNERHIPSMTDYYDACTGQELASYLGSPPTFEPTRLTTSCQVCPDGQLAFGNECAPILDIHVTPCRFSEFEVVLDTGTYCFSCPHPDDIAWFGECHSCPPATPIWHGNLNKCVAQCTGSLTGEGHICQKLH